jgi:photosystem II stability/assembly factor-like uncharacterized protein
MGCLGWLVVLLASGCAAGSALSWERIGPDTQSVVSLALLPRNPPTIFAGSNGHGLFRSMDGGKTWAAVNTDLPSGLAVNSIVLDETQIGVLYIGTDAGVFRSDSDGEHWQSASVGLPGGVDGAVTALLLDPDDPMTLYAGTVHKGLYISHDEAKSWSASAQGLPAGATVHALLAEIKGQKLRLFAALAGAGVYQSGDKGASWSASSSGIPAGVDGLSLLDQPSDPGGLYAGTSAGIYRSTDDGASWKAVNAGLGQPPAQVFALGLNDQRAQFLYAATSAGVYRSVDGGTEWDAVATGMPPDHPAVALAIMGSAASIGTIYAASGQTYRYPNTAGSVSGQIFTFAILGILALLFFWLFLRQRRLLQRLTPPPPDQARQSGREPGQIGPQRASVRRVNTGGAAEGSNPAGAPGKDEEGSEAAESGESH